MPLFPNNKFVATVAGAVWLLTVAVGLGMLMKYERAPGSAGAPPNEWPVESKLGQSKDRATLVTMARKRVALKSKPPVTPCSSTRPDISFSVAGLPIREATPAITWDEARSCRY